MSTSPRPPKKPATKPKPKPFNAAEQLALAKALRGKTKEKPKE